MRSRANRGVAAMRLAIVLSLAGCLQGAEPLDIKTGMWEISLSVRTKGLPPLPAGALRQLTPEQRALYEQRSKEAAAPQTVVKRECLEAAELRQPWALSFGLAGQGCRQNLVESSARLQEIHVDCGHDTTKGGGTIRIEAFDREHAKVTTEWFGGDGARKVGTGSIALLKWLSPICGAEFGPPGRAVAV